MIMDDPDAMKAVGKVWVHWLEYGNTDGDGTVELKGILKGKMILVKLVMVDLLLLTNDIHTSSNYMHLIQILV